MFNKSLVIFTTIALSTLTTFPANAATFKNKDIAIVENNSLYTEIKDIVTEVVMEPIVEEPTVEVEEVAIVEEVITEEVVIEETAEIEETTNVRATEPTYIAVYSMESTAYTGGGITASGAPVARNPEGLSTVAVDPNVIPLGSLLHIPGYGYAVAADTGGAIKGNILDVYLNTYEECISWGRRHITVNLVAYPGQW